MIELIPLEGIRIEGMGEILLGQTRADAEAVLGLSGNAATRHYYFGNELAVDYDKNGNIEFIECLGPDHINPIIYGREVFKIEADELVALLTENNQGRIDDDGHGFDYSFLETSVGIYRECRPEDIEESIAESIAEGAYSGEEKAQLETELENSKHFQTIGIGIKDYYSNS